MSKLVVLLSSHGPVFSLISLEMLKFTTVSLSIPWMHENLKYKIMVVSDSPINKGRTMSKLGGNICDQLNYKSTFNGSELKKQWIVQKLYNSKYNYKQFNLIYQLEANERGIR